MTDTRAPSGNELAARPVGMAQVRQFRFDRGDWIATRDPRGEWHLAGKVVDADAESITVESRGLRTAFVVGEDIIAHVRWRGKRWSVP